MTLLQTGRDSFPPERHLPPCPFKRVVFAHFVLYLQVDRHCQLGFLCRFRRVGVFGSTPVECEGLWKWRFWAALLSGLLTATYESSVSACTEPRESIVWMTLGSPWSDWYSSYWMALSSEQSDRVDILVSWCDPWEAVRSQSCGMYVMVSFPTPCNLRSLRTSVTFILMQVMASWLPTV